MPSVRTRSGNFQVSHASGGVLMSISVVLLAVGHGIPRQEPVLGDKDGIELIRTSALTFNKILRTCQVVGLALFCSGGLFVAGGN